MGWLDLHMHSTYSNDGEFTPEQLMGLCKKAGLKTVALADHNCVRGIKEAAIYAEKLDIQLIHAVELDCSFQNTDLHLLGFGIDETCIEYEKIELNVLHQEQIASKMRMELIENMGFVFEREEVMKLSKHGVVTGEMIAETLLNDKRNKENIRMQPYYLGGERSDNPYVNFYWDFCSKDKAAYVKMDFMELSEAVNLITKTGGIPVLAHPGNNVKENKKLMHNVIKEGIKGLEVYSSYHSTSQTKIYEELADHYGLIRTIGSDFHGKTKPSVKLGEVNCHNSEEIIYSELMKRIGIENK